MTNNGLVLADLSGGLTIDMNNAGMINTATLRAGSTGTLTITGSTVVTNAGGTIDSATGGVVQLTGASRTIGGFITGPGTVLILGGAALENVSNFATITQSDNNAAFITTTFNNFGTYRLNSVGNASDLQIQGNTTISGTGQITSSNTSANRIYAQGGTARLTNASGHTIRGSMQLGTNGMALTNEGAIIADQTGGFTIDPSAGGFSNAGLLQRTSSATLTITDGFTTSGIVQCDAGGTLRLSNGAWPQTGGLVTADGIIDVTSRTYNLTGGTLGGNGRVIATVNNTSGTLNPGTFGGADQTGTLIIEGNYTQGPSGNLSVMVGGTMSGDQNDLVTVLGTGVMGGTITIGRENGYVPPAGQAFTILTTNGTNSRTGTFSAVSTSDFWNVVYLHNAVVIVFNGLGAEACNIDFNNDGIIEPGDLDEFITAFFEGC
ncbi:MAG: hypothetical protein ACT4PL_14035, partial [Phycisphaerales bacterium]